MNLDRGDMDTVRRFVKSMDVTYPVAVTSQEVERGYGVTGLPTTILIDKEGRIREKIAGYTNGIAKQMTAKVIDLLSQEQKSRVK
jgi:thioredoxin-related protein